MAGDLLKRNFLHKTQAGSNWCTTGMILKPLFNLLIYRLISYSTAGWTTLTDLRGFQTSSGIPVLTFASRGSIAPLSILSLSSVVSNALYGVIHFSQIFSSSGLSLSRDTWGSVAGWGTVGGGTVEAGGGMSVGGLSWKRKSCGSIGGSIWKKNELGLVSGSR